jgi:hypothetical protein
VREGTDADHPFTRIYYRAGSSAAVAARSRSWYWDDAADTLYVNTGGDANALVGGLEVAGVSAGWVITGDNVRVENLALHGYGLHDPALNLSGIGMAGPDGAEHVLVDVDVWYTGYHAVVQNPTNRNYLTCVRCRAGLCTSNTLGGVTVYNSFSANGLQEMVLHDCETSYGTLPSSDWTTAATGQGGTSFFAHTTGLPPGLLVASRTRYPASDWGVNGPLIGCAVAARVEDVRAFIYGEEPGYPCYPSIGVLGFSCAVANSRYDLGIWDGTPGVDLGAFVGRSETWLYNCTFKADATPATNFGGGYSWFYSNGGATVEVRADNCRFEMTAPATELGNLIASIGGVAGGCLFRNCTFVWKGVGPGVSRTAASGLDDTNLVNCAYYFSPANVGYGTAEFVGNTANPVVLAAEPSADYVPYPGDGLFGGGAANDLGWDFLGAARPLGRRDIGPVGGADYAAPALAVVAGGFAADKLTYFDGTKLASDVLLTRGGGVSLLAAAGAAAAVPVAARAFQPPRAADFDANLANYLSASDVGLPVGQAPLGISLWFRPESLTGYQILFAYGTPLSGEAVFLMLDNAKVCLSQWGVLSTGVTTLLVNTWYHLIVTRVGTTWTAYLDNVPEAGASATMANTTTLSGALYLGHETSGNFVFDGQLDMVGVAAVDFTAGDRTQLNNGNAGRQWGDLSDSLRAKFVRWYDLDELSGVRVDRTGNADMAMAGTVGSATGKITGTPQSGDLFQGQDEAGNVLARVRHNGALGLPTLADADAANESLYNSSTNGKLSWKDAGGTVTPLY